MLSSKEQKWIASGHIIWYLLLLTTLVLPTNQISPVIVGPKQVCQTETFKVMCRHNEIINMTQALYGRMQIGRCITKDYGHVSCYVDVTMETSKRCSGRRVCEIRIPDKIFEGKNSSCPLELRRYFEASYSCTPVATPKSETCPPVEEQILTSTHGYLANIVTEENGAGGLDCPWTIQVPKGQRIDVILHDYSLPTLYSNDGFCAHYGIISELAPKKRNTRICGGDVSPRKVFSSDSNSIEVRIHESIKHDTTWNHFVFEYKAVGCPYLDAPEFGLIEQDSETVTIDCNYTGLIYKLKCKGDSWVGDYQNCTMASVGYITIGNISLPFGISIGIITSLAVIIAVIILLVCIICVEWGKMSYQNHSKKTSYPSIEVASDTMSTYSKCSKTPDMKSSKSNSGDSHNAADTRSVRSHSIGGASMNAPSNHHTQVQVSVSKPNRNDYTKLTSEMWPASPTQGGTANLFSSDDGGKSNLDFYGPFNSDPPPPERDIDTKHIYDSPEALRREVMRLEASGADYFDLDNNFDNAITIPEPQGHLTLSRPKTSVYPTQAYTGESPNTPEDEEGASAKAEEV